MGLEGGERREGKGQADPLHGRGLAGTKPASELLKVGCCPAALLPSRNPLCLQEGDIALGAAFFPDWGKLEAM